MDLSNQLQLNEIPEPQRSTILAALTEIVLSKLALSVFDKLSNEDQAYLQNLDEGKATPDDVLAFLQSRLPGLDSMINQIIEQEKVELSDKTNQLLQVMQTRTPLVNGDANAKG